MPAPIFYPGATAVITGAASGIGLALATHCAQNGMNLLLLDLDTSPLESLPSSYPKQKILLESADVSTPHTWADALTLAKDFEHIDALFLNAGTLVHEHAGIVDISALHRTFATNFFGVAEGLASFLGRIKESAGAGRKTAVVITGSKQGITNPPGNPAYNASKAAVKSLTEGLAFELEQDGFDTSVHLLVPGWTFTSMTGNGKTEKPAGAWSPEQVVDYLDKKISEGKFYIICPDNEVDEETDKKRMLWSIGDVVYGRPALSRWRKDTKESAAEEIKHLKV